MKWQLLLIGLCVASSQKTTPNIAGQSTERNLFAADIYQSVAPGHLNDNVVISPAAIQSSMALAFSGARGQTAQEMQSGLRLGSADAEQVARSFGDFQKAFTRDNSVRIFNKIYINENLEFKGAFKDIAQRNFDSTVEKADFHPPYNRRTADRINKEIEAKTNGKIEGVLQAQQLDDNTQGVIVNAITYSAPWQKAFKPEKTTKRPFRTNTGQTFEVDTMWALNDFRYGEFRDLDAKVVELPYQNSKFSMIVVLPNQVNGLDNVVQRLANKNLVALVDGGLSSKKVEVQLPKFSVKFGVNLVEPFKKLGVTTMFTRSGDFGDLYRMFVSHFINSADHKAYIEVTEAGSEPSKEKGGFLGLFSNPKKFEASHPFIFAVRYEDSIIFMGHISNYAYV